MFVPTALVLLSVSSLVIGKVPFEARNCHGVINATDSLDMVYVKMKKDPVEVPGVFEAALKVVVKKKLNPNIKYDLELKILKYTLFRWVKIPCILGVGSCKYDMCDFLKRFAKDGCPTAFTKVGFPCQCHQFNQIKVQTYTIPMSKFTVEKNLVPTSLLYGDYKISVRVREHVSQVLRSCAHFQVSLAAPSGACNNIICDIIG